ncbi:hypothetical protein GW17_00055575 [Ensete ventricosum]|nr:hypothetical protein GW17_00055575 [Ensete ventricosum]
MGPTDLTLRRKADRRMLIGRLGVYLSTTLFYLPLTPFLPKHPLVALCSLRGLLFSLSSLTAPYSRYIRLLLLCFAGGEGRDRARNRGGGAREMLLRKRPRPPMRRTTSMAEFAPNAVLPNDEAAQPSSECAKASDVLHHQREPQRPAELPAERRDAGPAGWLEARYQRVLNSSPGGGRNRRSSGDFSVVETAPFLRACGLCKRSLGPGRDTFMYRYHSSFIDFHMQSLIFR